MSRSGKAATERRAEAEGGFPARVSFGWNLALDLGMALLLGVGLGFLQANADYLAVPVPRLVVTLTGAGVMGLLFGLTARLILRGWTGMLKFLLSLVALLLWMVAAAATYAAWSGLHLLAYLSGGDKWVKVGQLAVGSLSILAATLAGRRAWEVAPLQWIYRLRSQTPPPATKASLKWGLGLTLATAVVLGAGSGFLQANVGRSAVPVPPLVVALGGAGVMGLLTGLTVRLTLRGWSEGLRIAVTWVALLVWLVEAEATYAVAMGLRPLGYLAGADNWIEMGQLAVGCLGAVVGGVGRRRAEPIRTGAVEVGPAPQRARKTVRQPRQAATARQRRAISLPKFRLPALTFRRPRPANNSQVKVIAKEEDRCPYCLDVIEKNDPRGVVVCEICGAPHHADCWEVGGKCQVPHLSV